MQNQNKKSFNRKYIIAAAVFLLIIAAMVVSSLKWELKPDPASDKIIREAAAIQLNKDANDLTDEDFAKITEFDFYGKQKNNTGIDNYFPPWAVTALSDIRLLKKFTNLEQLDMRSLKYPAKNIPKWMKYLAMHGIFNLDEKYAIDLSPIKSLYALKKLRLSNSQISDITPLKNLTNLELLYIDNTLISDLEPLKGLTNLQVLHIGYYQNITEEQIEDLRKSLPNLKILYRPDRSEQVLITKPPE